MNGWMPTVLFCRDDFKDVTSALVKHLTYIVYCSDPNSECLLELNYSKLLPISATQLALLKWRQRKFVLQLAQWENSQNTTDGHTGANNKNLSNLWVDCVWNAMAHAQKPDFVFRLNGPVHLNRSGHQFSRLLAVEVCASAVVTLDTPCSEEVWRVLATHSIRQFPLHFPSSASPCAITFQLDSN